MHERESDVDSAVSHVSYIRRMRTEPEMNITIKAAMSPTNVGWAMCCDTALEQPAQDQPLPMGV